VPYNRPKLVPCARCGAPVLRRPRPDRKPYHLECAVAVVQETIRRQMREAAERRAAREAERAIREAEPIVNTAQTQH